MRLTTHRRPALRRSVFAAPVLAVALGLAACASGPQPTGRESADADAHDVGAGDAAEVASPALALIVADEHGALTLLDLETEQRTVLAQARDDVESVDGDGRLIYIAQRAGAGSSVDVIDSGRWTVPHGDHAHSFRGEPGLVGTIDGEGAARIRAGEQRAALQFDGEVFDIAHEDLSAVDTAPRVDVIATGPVLAFAGHLLVPNAGGTVEVHDASGEVLAGSGMPCTDATDADITRVGAVFSCTEGAVLFVREVGGAVTGEAIPYPAGASGAAQLAGRPDRPDLAGAIGGQGAWLLDVRQRAWTPLPSDVPLLRAVAVGDDEGRTIALDAEGRVRIIAQDGSVLARTEPLLAASLDDPATLDDAASLERIQLLVDAQHAYLTDPAASAVYELDHRDDARLTRTFTDLDPWFVHQVG